MALSAESMKNRRVTAIEGVTEKTLSTEEKAWLLADSQAIIDELKTNGVIVPDSLTGYQSTPIAGTGKLT